MRLVVAIFVLIAGAFVAIGRMSAAQLGHVGSGLLALILAHWLTLLPWLLAVLFACLWWRQREITAAFRDAYIEKVIHPVTTRRKRATR